jgi:glycosyltransferase involved in cell wall biosynthesis
VISDRGYSDLRIALLVPGFSADETDWCIPALRHLVGRLAKADEVHVFALRYPYRAGRYELFGARVTALGGAARDGMWSPRIWRSAFSALASEHRSDPFDTLHAFWANETGAVAAVAGRILGIPTVVSLAGGELVGLRDIEYGGQLVWTERIKVWLALHMSSRVTAGSRGLLSLAAWRLGGSTSRLVRVPLGVNLDLFHPPAAPCEDSRPRLIQVASLVSVKDQTTLLRSAALLRERGLDFRLEIAGSGPLQPELRNLTTKLKLESLVDFRGDLCHDVLPSFYGGASVFVQSSRHEAQGMAVLEAAACGVPACGTRVGALAEMEPDAASGAPTADSGALASAVAPLLENPERRAGMGEAARALAESEYGLEKCVERFRALYAELV